MMRDPAELNISSYFYVMGNPKHPYNKEFIENNITLDNLHELSAPYSRDVSDFP